MTDLDVTRLEQGSYGVQVTEGTRTTSHKVTVPDSMLEELGLTDADAERVVRESFAFLLEREPATSILGEFSLDAIGTYFPEYAEELPRRLGG